MQPLELTHITRESEERTIADYIAKWKEGNETMRAAFPASCARIAEIMMRTKVREIHADAVVYSNDVYQVSMHKKGEDFYHLSIKRIDRQPIHDWRDLQEIKNQLLGRECEAVELYPAESRKVDAANQYHLWGIKNPNMRLPFGFNDGRIVQDESFAGSINRPLKTK